MVLLFEESHIVPTSRSPLTMTEAIPFLPGLSLVEGKALTATFDGGRLSSDGGVIVLREIEQRLGVAETITKPLPDARDPTRVVHSYNDMTRARLLAIAAGYEDCNDLDGLCIDPVFKMGCDRAPDSGQDLMSQPTLSRLENLPQRRALVRIGIGMIDLFCRSYATPPARIELDIDETEDAVHGGQQLALFNAHYDSTCFLPIHIFEAISGKPVFSLLRPGKRPSGEEGARILRHVIRRIRKHWPKVEILVRGDSHYGTAPVLALLEKMRCDYIIGLAINSILKGMAEPWLAQCNKRCGPKARPNARKVRRFHQFPYAAGTWSRMRKVIARVEATEMGTDVRFIVTNLVGRGKTLYEKIYCARGSMENLIKDLKRYTRSDKTACSRWEANQFRLFLHMGAYWLLHTLRRSMPRRSIWRGATFETIRRCFVKVAVRVTELKSRIKIAFPAAYPYAQDLIALTGRLTAQGP